MLIRILSSGKMEIPAPSSLCSLIVTVLFLLLPETSVAEPRSQIVQIICGNETTVSVQNFVGTMELLSEQMSTRGYGVAVTGARPDTTYGLGQCYGDLSLIDCVLCYVELRTLFAQCFPNNGARLYQDGCFVRAENYTFYDQYIGPEDRHVCGNRTTKGTLFQPILLELFKNVIGCVSNFLQVVYFWSIRHECGNVFRDSEQLRFQQNARHQGVLLF